MILQGSLVAKWVNAVLEPERIHGEYLHEAHVGDQRVMVCSFSHPRPMVPCVGAITPCAIHAGSGRTNPPRGAPQVVTAIFPPRLGERFSRFSADSTWVTLGSSGGTRASVYSVGLPRLKRVPNPEEWRWRPLLLKIPEVMARLAVGQTKVYELMSSGELRSVKVGRSRRVPSDELERFMAELDDSRTKSAPARAEGVHGPRFVAPFPQARGRRCRWRCPRVTLAFVSIRARSCA